jgi:hypothetical protein
MARRQFLGIPIEAMGLSQGSCPEATSEKTATTGLSEGAAPDAVNEKAARTGDASEKAGKDGATARNSDGLEGVGNPPAAGMAGKMRKTTAPAALAIVRPFIFSSFDFP